MRLCYLAEPLNSHTIKWLSYFVERGDEVHLLGWDHPRPNELLNVNYHYLPNELQAPFTRLVRSVTWRLGLWPVAHLRQMQVLLDRIQPDIFDILMINAEQIPAALAHKGPLVVTPWGHDLLVFPQCYSLLTRLFLRLALRRADLILCNSGQLREAAHRLGARRERIRDVNQIVDLRRFHPELDGSAFRHEFGLGQNQVLLSPRLLDPDYQIHTLIDAMPHILKKYSDCRLILLGDRSRSPYYFDLLKNQVRRLKLDREVIFAGYFTNDKMPEILAAANIVLSVPVSDSRPSSVFEAMACGVPVLVSDVPAIHEIVVHGETGYIVDINASGAIAQGICHLLGEPQLSDRIAAQALEYVRRTGDYATQMERVANYYDELLRSK